MSVLLRRIAGVFVAPAEDCAGPDLDAAPVAARRLLPAAGGGASSTSLGRAARLALPVAVPEPGIVPPPAAALGVVCAGRDVALAGAAAALALVERGRARCAVVMEWTGIGDRQLAAHSAAPSARRRAAALEAAGLAAVSCGRLVRVALPAAEVAAVEAARIVAPETPGVPVVLAVGGPRAQAMEALLGEQDAILLAARPGHDAVLVGLAAAELEALGRPVSVVRLPPSPFAGALARAGIALASPLRSAALAAVDAG